MANESSVLVRMRLLGAAAMERDARRGSRGLLGIERSARRVDRAGRLMRRGLTLIGVGSAITAVGYAAKSSIGTAMDYQQEIANIGAVAGSTRAELKQLREQALAQGAATRFSAREAAQGQLELAKAGVSTREILGGGLQGTLSLAAAGNIEVGEAAAYAANGMNLFGMRGKDVTRIADAFATAANTTTADVGDFGAALTQGGAAAKAAGYEFNEAMVVLEALAKAGVKNSDAGTSMKTAFLQLLNPTKKQRAAARELGLEFVDQNGHLKDAAALSEDLRRVTGRMTKAERVRTLATLAGTDGVRTLLALYDAGPKTLREYEKSLGKQGTAAATASKRQATLQGKVEQLGGAIETIKIRIGTAAIPSLNRLAGFALNNVVPRLDTAAKEIEAIWTRPGLSPGDRLEASWDAIKETGLSEDAKNALYDGIAEVGTRAPRVLIGALGEAPWPAKGVIAAILLAKFGPAFKLLGKPLARGLGGGGLGRGVGRAGAVPVWVVNGGASGVPGGPGGRLGGAARKGANIPGIGAAIGAGRFGVGGPLALGAGMIAAGIGLNELDKRHGLLGPSEEEARRNTERVLNAQVIAARQGRSALQAELQKSMLIPAGPYAARMASAADRGTGAFRAALARGGPKQRRTAQEVVNAALAGLQGLPTGAAQVSADSMVRMAASMERSGQAPRGTTKRLVQALQQELRHLPPATRQVAHDAALSFGELQQRLANVQNDIRNVVNASRDVESPGGRQVTQGEQNRIRSNRLAGGGYVGTPWQLVGEHGPELARLPHGSRVYPSRRSREMARAMAPAPGGPLFAELVVNLDGRELHRNTYRVERREMERR